MQSYKFIVIINCGLPGGLRRRAEKKQAASEDRNCRPCPAQYVYMPRAARNLDMYLVVVVIAASEARNPFRE